MNLDRYQNKLDRLKKLDPDQTIFGAESHEYRQNPPLPPEKLASFESQFGLSLPEDYREYLLKVADGGLGPFYGLYSLGGGDEEPPDYSKPFGLSAEENLRLFDVYAEIDRRLKAYGPAMDADLETELFEKYFRELSRDTDCGFVYLCTEGCGMYNILIVNGPAHGTVWFHDLANDAGIFPLTSPVTGKPLGFGEWLEIWLDTSISSLSDGSEELASYSEFIKQDN
ncbi:MAG: SMI1/KNR4 family protein [Deltaproteobacteria bacterium]|jgi:hypothetical protein|nr:SMI1/KNR4 family protein [Deltaproteobacteria bacterium]